MDAEAEWAIKNLVVKPEGTFFDVMHKGRLYGTCKSPMPGRHNALNALAVIAVLDRLGLDKEAIIAGACQF